MLKKKRGLNYRKAKRAEIKAQRCCWFCMALIWINFYKIGGKVLKQAWQCRVIGVDNSNRYAIGIDNLCDAFQKRQSPVPEGKESA